jgi:hypothetical protein
LEEGSGGRKAEVVFVDRAGGRKGKESSNKYHSSTGAC